MTVVSLEARKAATARTADEHRRAQDREAMRAAMAAIRSIRAPRRPMATVVSLADRRG